MGIEMLPEYFTVNKRLNNNYLVLNFAKTTHHNITMLNKLQQQALSC